ncbi:MAG TPA: hypothetical protein ENJ46_04230 [Hellea balneolensis]|uniref:Inositolphosphotransferase Aur1/Ipt1 domain-containing protein n=1 Tax=Hellea balneolensis TaxID=287478 RepID=A0A7C3G074_9PROT|nr:hypothetical protein [Hellea balneolensis]
MPETHTIEPEKFASEQGFLAQMQHKLKPDWPFVRVMLLAILALYISGQILFMVVGKGGHAPSVDLDWYAETVILRVIMFLFGFWIFRLVQFNRKLKGGSLFPALMSAAKANPFDIYRRFVLAGFAIALFSAKMGIFMSMKAAIPDIIPFYFDTFARKIDYVIFFGHDPWRALSFLYTSDGGAIKFIDFFYMKWAPIVAGVWFYCFTSDGMERLRRYQYCLASLILFVLGGLIVATLLSSAGPVYYAYFTGDQQAYAGLLSELSRINETKPLSTLRLQGPLLELYQAGERRVGGISAMPSMHCGSSFLILVAFWQNKKLRIFLAGYAALIYVGSFLLAWHYAIDGLVVIPLVWISWTLAGWILRRYAQPTPA